MATKKRKAVRRTPSEFIGWAIVREDGKFVQGWHFTPEIHRTKTTAQSACYYGDGERVVRVRITEVIK